MNFEKKIKPKLLSNKSDSMNIGDGNRYLRGKEEFRQENILPIEINRIRSDDKEVLETSQFVSGK